MIPRQHSVRFYEDDVFLTEAIASRIKLGLQVNDTLIVIVPASHRPDLRKLLTPDELANTHLMFLDSTSLLSKIMGDDWPNQPEFLKVVGSRIQRAYQTVRLRVYGEMVAVLGAGGNYRDALRERPWNTPQTVPPFSLLHTRPHSALPSKADPSLLAVRHDTHVQCQKTGTSPLCNRYIVAAVVSLPSSLYLGNPRLLLCFARVARRRDVSPQH